MASNFKISELTALGRAPGAADTVVINDNSGINPQTRSATVTDLAGRILNTPIEANRGGVLYDPVYFTWNNARHTENFPEWYEVDQNRKTIVDYIPDQDKNLSPIFDWCPNLDTKTHTMPKNANRALLLWQYQVNININEQRGRTKTWWNAGWDTMFPFTANVMHLLTFGNAELRGNPNMNRTVDTLGSITLPSFTCMGNDRSYLVRGSGSSESKIDILSFDPGATISIDLEISVMYANMVEVGTTPVRLILIPYYDDGSGLPIASLAPSDPGQFYIQQGANGLRATNQEKLNAYYSYFFNIDVEGGDVPPVITEETTKSMDASELRAEITYILTAIVGYDPTGANSTLTGYRNDLLALNGSSDDFATLAAEVKRIRGLAATEIGFGFSWETRSTYNL